MNFIKRFVIGRATVITVVSGAMIEDITALGVEREKISLQPMGIDFENRFTPDPEIVRSSDEILFVGRLVKKRFKLSA